MKRATIKILGALLLVSILGTSCKKYLDINKNPNAAEVVDPKLLFSNAIVNYVNVRAAGDLYIPISLAGQAIASGGNNPTAWGFPTEEQYDVNMKSPCVFVVPLSLSREAADQGLLFSKVNGLADGTACDCGRVR